MGLTIGQFLAAYPITASDILRTLECEHCTVWSHTSTNVSWLVFVENKLISLVIGLVFCKLLLVPKRICRNLTNVRRILHMWGGVTRSSHSYNSYIVSIEIALFEPLKRIIDLQETARSILLHAKASNHNRGDIVPKMITMNRMKTLWCK